MRADDVDGQNVDVAAVQEKVAGVGVANGRQVARERHAGPNIAPKAAVGMDALFAG